MTVPAAPGVGAPEVEAPEVDATEAPAPPRIAALDLALAAVAFLVPVLWSNRAYMLTATPKSALLLVTAGPGLVALVALLRRRDAVAIAASAFLLLAALSALLADVAVLSFTGDYFARTGWLFLAAVVGLWALGRWRGPSARLPVLWGLVAAALVNAAVGWLQVSVDLDAMGLSSYGGRARGLLGNPVFFGAFLAAALCLLLDREREHPRPLLPLVAVGFVAGAVELSGSRIALGAALVVLAWFGFAHLRAGRRMRAGAIGLALVAGVALAQVPDGAAGSTSERVGAAPTSGIDTRVALWRTGLEGLAERPVLGFGPGRSYRATAPHRTLQIVRYDAPDVLHGDAHNFLVETLLTTGILGFAALLTWLVLAARHARGALCGFAATAAVVTLVQPVDLGVTPVVLLALGLAAAPEPPVRASTAGRRDPWVVAGGVVAGLLALVGAVAGVRLVQGDIAYERAIADGSGPDAERARSLLPPWPQPAALLAVRDIIGAGRTDDADRARRGIRRQLDAIERDPGDPRWWYLLGDYQRTWATLDAAERSYREALRRDPWSARAQYGLMLVAIERGDLDEAGRWRARLCRIGDDYCPPRSVLQGPP